MKTQYHPSGAIGSGHDFSVATFLSKDPRLSFKNVYCSTVFGGAGVECSC